MVYAPARNGRDWQPDLAVLAYAEIDGNKVRVHNIRNCDYRAETDLDVRHCDKTFDLEQLRTADLFMVYWGSPNMAHTMVGFGFEGGDQLCFSIETRKEKGEGYSAVKRLFRQFEVIYVLAHELDVVRLRTNYRKGEDAYLYRLRGSPRTGARRLSRLCASREGLAPTARVVQCGHPQLHDQHPHAARRGSAGTMGLADAGERPRRRTALRARPDHHQPAAGRVAAAGARQRARPRGGQAG